MPNTEPTASATDGTAGHSWVVAAEITVNHRVAKYADYRGSFRTPEQTRVEALEVYCGKCRRPFADVVSEDCAADIDNHHLIGGDHRVRAKRNVPDPVPNARIIPGPAVSRRGIDAYMNGITGR